MKKYIPYILLSTIVVFILSFIPSSTEHAVVIDSSSGYTNFYVEGKVKKIKTRITLPKNSVVNYKHNLYRYYGFKTLSPKAERIMIKSNLSYDLESSGKIQLAKAPKYYVVDEKDNITPCTSRNLIVGKSNVKSYINKKNKLQTFIIYPMDYSQMRVSISTTNFSSIYHDKVQIKCMESSLLYTKKENFSLDIPENSDIFLEQENDKLKIVINNTTKYFSNRIYLKGKSMYVNNVARGIPPFIPSYDGILEFSLNEKGILIINEVNMEDYLCKVVPSEMPSSGGLESLKCQAIAARTYAISDMLQNRFASLGFYVDDSTQSQVYNNIQPQPLATKAVTQTKGTIISYKSKPIDAKYYSSSAGTGVYAKDIWFKADGTGDNPPYLSLKNYLSNNEPLPKNEEEWLKFYKNTKLKAVDSSSPYFRWYIIFTPQSLERSLNKSLKNLYDKKKDYMTIIKGSKKISMLPELKNLKDVKVIKRSEGGNILEISFIFETATVNVRSDYCVRGAIRCSKNFAGETVPIQRYKWSPMINSGFLPSSFFSIEKTEGNFIIYGGGYGHGVGMSQYGAMELSKKGMKYEDILNTFYTDVTLDKIY